MTTMAQDRYTEEEVDLLEENYHKGIEHCMDLLPGRSYASIAKKASRIALSKKTLSWTEREDAVLRDCIRKGLKPAECRMRLKRVGSHRTYFAIQSRMRDIKRHLLNGGGGKDEE